MENLLMAILKCGSDDLSLLENSNADFEEIVEYLKDNGVDVNLQSIVTEMYENAKNDFFEKVNQRIENLKTESNLTKEEKLELDDISNLSEDDFSFYFNCLDTHMSIINNLEIYEKYFEEKIDAFEDYTGFNLERRL